MKQRKTSLHLRADPTRAKILKAAQKLFPEHGFSGTSIGKIASLAKINHSLIFHHFKNKENLWKAVKQTIVTTANRSSPTLPELNQPFSAFLQKLILKNIEFYKNHSDIARMIAWQRLEINNKKEIGITLSDTTKEWLHALKHFQIKGDIDKRHKPEFILTLILSIISSVAMDPNDLIKGDQNLNHYIKFLTGCLIRSLQSIS